jgi:GeoRSP system SPASM domain protein
MGLDLLDTPVRLTWDFPDDATGQASTCLPAIADSIADGGVFFVTLQGSPLLHPAIEEVLELLGGGCQLLISCRGSAKELERLKQLPLAGCQILLDVSDFIDINHGVATDRLHAAVVALRQLAVEPVVTLTPLRNNLSNIPELLRFCSEHQITKLKLPNALIGDSFQEYLTADLPRWQDLEDFRKIWLDFMENPCQLPTLEIHDLFLWEIMTPGQQQSRGEYGGCQAGNSLSHVDSKGVVHPCAAWPQPLGKLPDQSLEDIWSGDERMTVREQISKVAAGCQGCCDLDICFGGCRGLALHLNQSGKERDLMCSGPR